MKNPPEQQLHSKNHTDDKTAPGLIRMPPCDDILFFVTHCFPDGALSSLLLEHLLEHPDHLIHMLLFDD